MDNLMYKQYPTAPDKNTGSSTNVTGRPYSPSFPAPHTPHLHHNPPLAPHSPSPLPRLTTHSNHSPSPPRTRGQQPQRYPSPTPQPPIAPPLSRPSGSPTDTRLRGHLEYKEAQLTRASEDIQQLNTQMHQLRQLQLRGHQQQTTTSQTPPPPHRQIPHHHHQQLLEEFEHCKLELKAVRDDLKHEKANCAKLHKDIRDLSQRLQIAEKADVVKLQADLKAAKEQLRVAEGVATTQIIKNAELAGELATVEAKLSEQMSVKEREVRQLKELVASASSAASVAPTLNNAVASKDADFSKLQLQLQRAINAKEQAEAKLAEYRDRGFNTNTKQLSDATRKTDKLNQQLDEIIDDRDAWRAKEHEGQKRLMEAMNQTRAAKDRYEDVNKKCRDLEKQLIAEKSHHDIAMEKQMKELRSRYAEALASSGHHRDSAMTAKDMTLLEDQISDLKIKLRSCEQKCMEAELHSERFRSQVQRLQQDLAVEEATNSTLRQEELQLREQLSKTQTYNNNAQVQVGEYKAQVQIQRDEVDRRVEELTREKTLLRDKENESQRQLLDAQAHNRRLKDRINDLEARLDEASEYARKTPVMGGNITIGGGSTTPIPMSGIATPTGDRQISEIHLQLQMAQQKTADLETENRALQQQTQQLKQQHAVTDSTLNQLRDEELQLSEQNRKLQAQVHQLQKQVAIEESATKHLREDEISFREHHQALQQQVGEFKAKRDEAERKIEKLSEKLKQMTQKEADAQKQLTQLESATQKLERMKQKEIESQKHLEDVQAQNSKLIDRVEQYDEKLVQLQKEKSELQIKENEQQRQLIELEQQVKHNKGQSNVEAQLKQLQEKLWDERLATATGNNVEFIVDTQLSDLKVQLRTAEQRYEDTNAQAQRIQTQNQQLTQQLAVEETTCKQLRQQDLKSKEQIEALTKERTAHLAKESEDQLKTLELKSTVQQLRQQTESAEKRYNDLQEQYQRLQKDSQEIIDSQKAILKQLHDQAPRNTARRNSSLSLTPAGDDNDSEPDINIHNVDKRLEELKVQLRMAQQRVSDFEALNQTLRVENNDLHTRVAVAEAQCNKLKVEDDRMKSQVEEFLTERNHAQLQLTETATELQSYKQRLDESRLELEQVRKENNELTRQASELQTNVQRLKEYNDDLNGKYAVLQEEFQTAQQDHHKGVEQQLQQLKEMQLQRMDESQLAHKSFEGEEGAEYLADVTSKLRVAKQINQDAELLHGKLQKEIQQWEKKHAVEEARAEKLQEELVVLREQSMDSLRELTQCKSRIQVLEDTTTKLTNDNTKLLQENSELQRQTINFTLEIDKYKTDKDTMTSQLQQAQQAAAAEKDMVHQLREQEANMRGQLESEKASRAALEESQKQLIREMRELREMQESVSEHIQNSPRAQMEGVDSNVIETLLQDNTKLRDELGDVQQQLAVAHHKLGITSSTNSGGEGAKSEVDIMLFTENTKLRNEKFSLEKDLQLCKHQLQLAEQEAVSLDKQNATLLTQIAQLQLDLKQANDQAVGVSQDQLQTRMTQLDNEFKKVLLEKEKEVLQLEAKLQETKENLAVQTRERVRLLERIESTEDIRSIERSDAEKESAELRAEVHGLHQENTKLTERAVCTETENVRQAEEIKLLIEESTRLRAELEQAQSESSNKSSQQSHILDDYKQQVQHLQTQNNELQQQLHTAQTDFQTLQRQHLQSASSKASTTDQLSSLQQQTEDLNSQLSSTKQENMNWQQKMMTKNIEMKQIKDELNQTKQSLQAELAAKKVLEVTNQSSAAQQQQLQELMQQNLKLTQEQHNVKQATGNFGTTMQHFLYRLSVQQILAVEAHTRSTLMQQFGLEMVGRVQSLIKPKANLC